MGMALGKSPFAQHCAWGHGDPLHSAAAPLSPQGSWEKSPLSAPSTAPSPVWGQSSHSDGSQPAPLPKLDLGTLLRNRIGLCLPVCRKMLCVCVPTPYTPTECAGGLPPPFAGAPNAMGSWCHPLGRTQLDVAELWALWTGAQPQGAQPQGAQAVGLADPRLGHSPCPARRGRLGHLELFSSGSKCGGCAPPPYWCTHLASPRKGYQLITLSRCLCALPKCHRCPRWGSELMLPPPLMKAPPQRRVKQLPGPGPAVALLKQRRSC